MPLVRGIAAIVVAGVAFSAIAQQFGGASTGSGTPARSPASQRIAQAPQTQFAPPAQGQPTDQDPSAARSQPPGPAAPAQAQVDESALRYFAAQGDTRRLDAEIARLRALYPNWSPPTDLNQLNAPVASTAPPPDPEIDRLWSLFSEGRIAEVRAAIIERTTADPAFQVPPELTAALDTAEARIRLVNASDNLQWRTVLEAATQSPSLLTCTSIDALWRVAEAFAKTNQTGRSRDVYAYILTNCTNPAERLATLQKALPLLSEQQITDLLRLERKSGDEQDDFSEIRDQLAVRRVDRASNDNKQSASAEDLATVERLAQDGADPGNALVLGWYYYHHNEFDKARQWFQAAFDRNPEQRAAEGLALTLRAQNRFLEAENLAYEWRDRSPQNLSAYKDILVATLTQDPPLRLDPRVLASAVPVIGRDRFYNGAQALGWYSYNTNQFATARGWFEKALSWKADDEPSAYGLALSLLRLNDRGAFNGIAGAWRTRSPRIADLADGIFDRRDATADLTPVGPLTSTPQTVQGAVASPSQGLGTSSGTRGGYDPRQADSRPIADPRQVPDRTVAPERPIADDRQPIVTRPGEPRTVYDNRQPVPPRAAEYDAPVDPVPPRQRTSDMTMVPVEQPRPVAPRQAQVQVQAQVQARTQSPAGRQACNSGGNPYTLPAAGALALGWCLMDLNRPMEAVTAFDQAVKRGSAATKQDAAYGKSLAYLRKDLTREAAVAAAEAPQAPQRQNDLNATILSQRALAAYRDGRFTEAILALNERARVVPEQNDLMIIRGYAYYKLGRYSDAERVFRALLRTGSSADAAAGLNVVQEAIRPSRQF